MTSNELPPPGTVISTTSHRGAWWAAGGLGIAGAGALAAVLTAHPKPEGAPTPKEPPAQTAKAPVAKAVNHPVATAAVCATCGTVESVKAEKRKGEANGVGAVAGGVLGAVAGHQLGSGHGKDAMTVLGAVGGGFAGHEIEKQARSTTVYHVQLRMDDGSTRTLTQSTAPAVGARFDVEGHQLKALPGQG